MDNFKYASLKQFVESNNLKKITEDTLVILDIDGVFFKGIFDPREIIGLINPRVLKAFEKLLHQKMACWIMTNRLRLFKKFPYFKQLVRSIKKITNIKPKVYSDCKEFLEEDHVPEYAIIVNARKPFIDSQKVVGEGIDNFSKVIYIAARDLPFYFNDLKLVNSLPKTVNTKKLTFIEITNHKDEN